MANLRLLHDSTTWDAATVTGSSAAGTRLTAANLVHEFVARKWVTVGTSANAVVDLGAATEITLVGLFTFNLTAAATVTLQGHSSDSWGAPTYTNTLPIATDADGRVLERLVWFPAQTLRYWRLVVADAANPDGRLEIGRLVGGASWTPDRNFSRDWTEETADKSISNPMPGSQAITRYGKRFRRFNVRFNAFEATLAAQFLAMYNYVGNTRPLTVVFDPDDPQETVAYGQWRTPLLLGRSLVTRYSTSTLVFEEVVD